MSTLSRAIAKKRVSEETLAAGSRQTKINLSFFYKEGFACFERFKQIGWEHFLSLNETIYPELIREFYSNLEFDANSLEASVLIHGRRARLTKELLSELLKCPNVGICPEMVDDVVSASYSREEYIKELIRFESSMCPTGLLNADNRIFFHIVDQELAYGMIISVIAKHMRVEIDEYEGENAKEKSEEIPPTEEVPEPSKGGKRKTVKGTKKYRRASLYVRKSARLTKGKGKSEKIVEISDLEEEASSKSISAGIYGEVVPQKYIPLSLSVETESEKIPSQGPTPKPTKASSQPRSDSPGPNIFNDQFLHIMFRILSESRRSSHFHESTLIQLEKIHDNLLATNGALTSILQLLMKLMTEANVAPAAPTPASPSLRSHPRIENID
ncbi:glutamic acid-rich protein-like [Senna tora]|uniref:Glutamic acid-rich protein-like n=1 Tax=Senna tora TaxID=362788 RepID=A0A835CEU3_9FABA|nr:glutamic acid-rich protein-like [Senna tora]